VRIDKENGNNFWHEVIEKEMKRVCIASSNGAEVRQSKKLRINWLASTSRSVDT